MGTESLLVFIIIGAIAGWLAGLIVKGFGLGLIGNIVVGIVGAFWLTRVMESLLFSVSATDPGTFVAVPLVLVLVAVVACYVPARRATRVDPVTS